MAEMVRLYFNQFTAPYTTGDVALFSRDRAAKLLARKNDRGDPICKIYDPEAHGPTREEQSPTAEDLLGQVPENQKLGVGDLEETEED